jgi:hypothetical protein
LLWPDPTQRQRLVEIRDNLAGRIPEAEREGWLGEVEGLHVSLAGAEDKLAQIDKCSGRTTAVDLGNLTLSINFRPPERTPNAPSRVQRIVVSPELAEVLSAIISRVRSATGAIPLVRAYDEGERNWSPPLPLLFQRRVGFEHRAISSQAIRKMLTAAIDHTGLTDPAAGEPLRFTPHDSAACSSPTPFSTACHRTSLKSSLDTATSTSPLATKPSTPTRQSNRPWPFSPAGPHYARPTNTASPPTRNGSGSCATSNVAKSPSAPADAPRHAPHP